MQFFTTMAKRHIAALHKFASTLKGRFTGIELTRRNNTVVMQATDGFSLLQITQTEHYTNQQIYPETSININAQELKEHTKDVSNSYRNQIRIDISPNSREGIVKKTK